VRVTNSWGLIEEFGSTKPSDGPGSYSRLRAKGTDSEGNMRLPVVIDNYIRASNAHDVMSILSCFSEDAVVRDEAETLHGKKAIEGWIGKTIEKYKFRFEPLSVNKDDGEVVASVKVSGTFPGSPVTLDYHFKIENEKILSLVID
jgi:ketosteroid isomerase-like protein